MIFNSFEFLFFFVITYALYLALPHRGQNWMLLGASYFFYGYWDWRFLSLLMLSTGLDFYLGLKISEALDTTRKKKYVYLSVISNLTLLGFFKVL
mgnify:CR=1 FL=1